MKKNSLKYLYDKDKWMYAEEVPDIDFQFCQIWLSSFVNNLSKTINLNYKKVFSIHQGYHMTYYFGDKDSDQLANHILKKIVNDPKFGKKINNKIRLNSQKLKNFCRRIDEEYLNKLTNLQLAKLYLRLDKIHTDLYAWGWLSNAVDMFHGNFTNHIKKELKKKMPTKLINQSLMILTASSEKSIIQQEQESLLKIISLKQHKKSEEQIEKLLNQHLQKYFYLRYMWIGKGGIYNLKYYIKEINKYLKTGLIAAEELKREKIVLNDVIKERKELIKKYELNNLEKILDVYAEFAITKMIRRDAQIYWSYKMNFVFKELSKRLKIPYMDCRFMFPEEMVGVLIKGIDKALKNELKERKKYCVYYAEKGANVILTGKDACDYAKQVKEKEIGDIKEILGQIAYVGKVKGAVKIVNYPIDMKKMNQGDILVSIATNPDIVPAMKKAAAIVTEQGGITCHAAIVARELKIPCVIGTKIATKIFKDGDIVEVDASKGIVKKL